jgi:transcription termination/antitermination protein NusG
MLIEDSPENRDAAEEAHTPARDDGEEAPLVGAPAQEAERVPPEEPGEAPAPEEVAPPLEDDSGRAAAEEPVEAPAEIAEPPEPAEPAAEEPEPEDAAAEAVEPVLQPEESPEMEAAESLETAAEAAAVAEPAAGEAPAPETVETDQVPDQVVEAEPDGTAPAPPEAEAEAEPPSGDPFGGPGDWYVIHTYAGYENKVKTNLGSRIHTMQMQDKIFDVVIPMEDVMEIKGGKKQVVQKKVFPGYLLVKMVYDDDSWYVVRNTPGVTGFVSSGTGQKPTPLSRGEVEKILAVKKEEMKPTFRLDFEEGDVVRIISGPFADFNGTISDINVDQSKVRVMVNIFDRETPVELSFDQVARV